MLEKLLQSIIKKYCGQFLTGIENLELGVWSGKIHLQNTSLKHHKINQLFKAHGIPLALKYSFIGSLNIDIPWNKLTSAPVQVKIDQIYIVLSIEKIRSVDEKVLDEKLSLLQNYVQQFMEKALREGVMDEQSREVGFKQKLILKIINNLNFEIKNISIRIESSEDSFSSQELDENEQDAKTQSQIIGKTSIMQSVYSQNHTVFSEQNKRREIGFGFCIESLSLNTVNELNQPTYYNLQSQKSPLLKVINLQTLSVYWQQKNLLQLFKHNFEEKNKLLKSLISRLQHRLLTISGSLFMRKNLQGMDYLFQTNFQHINISGNYGQLQGIIKIISNFQIASKSQKLGKMQQLTEKEQEKLKPEFQKQFKHLYERNFRKKKLGEQIKQIIRNVSKKNLLNWSKEETVKILKETKLDLVKKEKNRKGVFSFLAAKAEIQLTIDEEKKVLKEVQKIVEELQLKKKRHIKLGINLELDSLDIFITHEQMKQNFKLNFSGTSVKFVSNKKNSRSFEFQISDITFIHSNTLQNTKTYLIRKYVDTEQSMDTLFSVSLSQSENSTKLKARINELEFNHQSKVLILLSELMKLKQKEQMSSDIGSHKIQLSWNQEAGSIQAKKNEKEYEIDFMMKTLRIKTEVSENSHLLMKLTGIEVKTAEKVHKGMLYDLSINFIKGKKFSTPIIKSFTVYIAISNSFDQIRFEASKLSVVFCQDDLRHIHKNLKKQIAILSSQKAEMKNIRIEDNAILQGQLKILTIFKDWRKLYAKLTDGSLYFYNPDLYDEQTEIEEPVNIIPLKDTSVHQVTPNRFKIESDEINELIECDRQICEVWVSAIEKVIYECSSKQKLFSMVNGEQKKLDFKSIFSRQIKITSQGVQILFCQTIGKNIAEMTTQEIEITLQEDEIKFEREFMINNLVIKNCLPEVNSDLIYLVSVCSKNDSSIKGRVSGKKKLHPQYRGELNINVKIPEIFVNYDAEFIYRIIRKITWNFEVPSYTRQMRDMKVLQVTQKYLKSKICESLTQKLKSSHSIQDDYSYYMELDKFKKYNTANVLLNINIQIHQAKINLLNGLHNICVFQANGQNLRIKMDKGTTFLFFKITATHLDILDTTNYPNTIFKPWANPSTFYPLIKPQQNRIHQECFQCTFSRFSLERFLNKDRLKSFFGLHLYDMEANYQNQPINRFVDYLLNPIIGFLMAPHELHKYDGPLRGPFKYYEYLDLTLSEVKGIIEQSIHPFFTKLIIKSTNLKANFNSHPGQQAIPICIQDLKFESYHYENPDRIRFNNGELQKIEKYENFKNLIGMEQFQNSILKNHWACKFAIVATGCSSQIFDNEFELSLIVERAVNSEKKIIFPFVDIDTSVNCKSWIQNMSIRAPKKVYDLINKCIMHNVSYDDKHDKYFTSYYDFTDLMVQNQLYYSLKAKELSIVIPELDQVIAIPDFEYIFLKHPSGIKQMYVYGKSLNIFGEEECLIIPADENIEFDERRVSKLRRSEAPQNEGSERGLEYFIEMKADGNKIMSVILRSAQITYKLDVFMKLLQYFLLDQSCYPPPTDFNDLPLIVCDVRLRKVSIKLLKTKSEANIMDEEQKKISYQYLGLGDISLIWTRNKVMHPDLYERDRSLFPSGQQFCSYKIHVKDFLLRKYAFCEKFVNNNSSYLSLESEVKRLKKNYRTLSHPISLVLTISQIMKMAHNGTKYNDNVFTIKVSSFLLRICYKDIQDIINSLKDNSNPQNNKVEQESTDIMEEMIEVKESGEGNQQVRVEPLPTDSPVVSMTKYTIDIKKFSVNLGLSELPVPILDFTLKNANISCEFLGNNKSFFFDGSIYALYWNMLIGKWESIIQRFLPKISMRYVKPKKHFILQCQEPFLANISMQALKVLSIIHADISEEGNFSFIRKNNSNAIEPKGTNVSPYILTNKTGFPLRVSSNFIASSKLNSDERMYIEVDSFDIQREQTQTIYFKIDQPDKQSSRDVIVGDFGWCEKEVRLDEAVTKKIQIRSVNNRSYLLYLKIISTPIMKEIILSSPYQIENKTEHTFIFAYDKYKIKVEPGEKLALNFMAGMKKRNLKINFPFLENPVLDRLTSIKQSEFQKSKKSVKGKVLENCEFPFEILHNGYEHQILLEDYSTFNVVISLDEDPETIITVQPAFYVKNLLPFQLPIDFTIVNEQQKKCLCSYHLQINEQKMIYDFSSLNNRKIDEKHYKINQEKEIRVRIKIKGYNISSFQSISDPLKPFEYKNSLSLIDYRGNEGRISMKIVKDGKVRRIYFYSEAVLINQTKFNYFVFANGNKFLPGQSLKGNFEEFQSPYLLINEGNISNMHNNNEKNGQINVSFGFRETSSESNQISVTEIGLQEVRVFKGSALYQFTVKNTLTQLDSIGKIYSNIMKAQPKYVVVNQTDSYLLISQSKVFTKVFQIRPEERLNWMWPNKSEQKKVVLKLVQNDIEIPGDQQQWDYSSEINFEEIEQQILVLRPKANINLRKLIQIIPIHEHQSTFLLIRQIKKTEDALVILKNDLKFNKIAVYQEFVDKKNPVWAEHKYFEVQPNTKIPFGWDYPNAPQQIVVIFTFLSYMKSQFHPFQLKIDISKQRTICAQTINIDNQVYEILVQIEVFGLKKIITFLKKEVVSIEDEEEQFMQGGGKIALNFQQIGISIIGKSSQLNRRVQVMYLHFKKVELIIMEKKTSKNFQLKIKYINIDNNMDHNTIYPIMLTPLKHEKTISKSRPFFVMILEQNINQDGSIKQIKELRVCLQPVSLKIQDEIIVALFDVIRVAGKIKFDDKEFIDLMSIYRAYQVRMEWQDIALHKPVSDIFIRELEIARLSLQITFSIRPKFNRQNFVITTILSSFGVAISNVSEAQLTLSRFSKKDSYFSQIKHEFMDFYLKQFIKGIYKVLGSINLFGNPYLLIRMFAEGTWEIINQPTEGFIKGPIEGGFGIIKGGVFFTRNLVAGVCNSFEAISQSVSRGVASMTMDEKFIERREKIKIQKSEHVLKGIQHGGFAIYTGFEVAVTGLVRHPAEGYEAKGFLGGCAGTLKGVAGLVTKPISGTFEGISKFSEGIKNTALLFQDGPNSKRIRPPRIFISELEHYKSYSYYDSSAIVILEKASTKYLNSRILYIHTNHEPDRQIRQTVVLTDKFFSKVNLLEEKIVIDMEINEIEEMTLHEESLAIKIQGGMILPIHSGNLKQLYLSFKKLSSQHHQQGH